MSLDLCTYHGTPEGGLVSLLLYKNHVRQGLEDVCELKKAIKGSKTESRELLEGPKQNIILSNVG